jgi:predicted nucleic acid-binding protein
MDVVVDTDVLSTFLKVRRPDLIPKLFPKSKIFFCPAVVSEIHRAAELGMAVETRKYELDRIQLTQAEKAIAKEIGRRAALGRADCECLAVAQFRMSLLLSNDRTVRGEASSRGIDVMNLPQMLRGLWRTGVMKKEGVAKLAEEVERKDNVVFKDRRLIFG